MEKYFMGICWINGIPFFEIHDSNNNIEKIEIPKSICIEKIDQKKCSGIVNPLTREKNACNKIINENDKQCLECKYKYDFYKCVKCHGANCIALSQEVIEYCNTEHYVYIAYFNRNKIKVGTVSKIRKYDRLYEQGAIYFELIAMAPTGKIARQIEQEIINLGYVGGVTTKYKMENIIIDEHLNIIKDILDNEYQNIINNINDKYKKYFIKSEFNYLEDIYNKIKKILLKTNNQLCLFDTDEKIIEPFIIEKNYSNINGKILFVIGKIMAIQDNSIIKFYDTKKMEGYLYKFI